MAWKKLKTNFWTPTEVGEVKEGVVTGTEETNFGTAVRMELLHSDESILFNYTALEKLEGQVGNKVKIKYLGEKTPEKGGPKYKDFDVFLWTEEEGEAGPEEEAVISDRLVEFTSKEMDITEGGARDMLQNDEVRQKWQQEMKNSDAKAEVGVG